MKAFKAAAGGVSVWLRPGRLLCVPAEPLGGAGQQERCRCRRSPAHGRPLWALCWVYEQCLDEVQASGLFWAELSVLWLWWMGIYLCLHCLQIFFCVTQEMCAELRVRLAWRVPGEAPNSGGCWVFCRSRAALSCECPAGQAGWSTGLELEWPVLVVARGPWGTQALVPLRSLQMPLGAISPAGAAGGIQVVVAL